MNKIILIGNLTAEPGPIRTIPGKTGNADVCDFSIAVNRRYEDKADFFRISVFGKLATNCSKYLRKGRKVGIVGELQARTYQAKDGTTHMSLDVRADEVEFLSPSDKPGSDVQMKMEEMKDIPASDIPF